MIRSRFTQFTLFTQFTPECWCKGVNSKNSSYLHYLHLTFKKSGVNNQIEHIYIPKIEGGTIDHSNARIQTNGIIKNEKEPVKFFSG